MLEGQAVAEKLGVKFALSVDKRIAGGAEVGAHKTSMLQDLEKGRPLEIEALLGAVVEMADWVGVDMPIGRAVLALVRQRAVLPQWLSSRSSSSSPAPPPSTCATASTCSTSP